MINHMVIIGQYDVSFDVISVKINQSISVDSDPAKLEVVLANRHQKYTMPTTKWPLQVTKLRIYLTGKSTLGTDADNPDTVGEDAFQLAAVGHITSVSANAEEATVTGECDIGHLADALHTAHNFKADSTHISEDDSSCIEILKYVLSTHKPPIELRMGEGEQAKLDIKTAQKSWEETDDFYTVIEDIRDEVGAVFWSNEEYIIDFHDPKSYFGVYNLDKYLVNPDQTSSIMGFCNVVNLCGNPALVDDPTIGSETSDEPPIILQVIDQESFQDLGALVAPIYVMYDQPSGEEAIKRAIKILKFFKTHENALTKPVVCTILPPIQSKVVYKPFIPIDGESESDYKMGQVKGIVIERVINYSAEGLETELTISPGLATGSTDVIENDDVDALYYPPSPEETEADDAQYIAYYYKDGELQGPGKLIEGPNE